jgi:hypothetical protein
VNDIEIGQLLGVCASYDRRTIGAADVLAWAESIGNLDYQDCEQAIALHYRDSTEWIMPGHIRNRVRAIRGDRLRRAAPLEFTPEVNDDPALYLAALRARTRRIADGPRPAELTAAEDRRAIGGAQ